jgi:hypothetical protein
MSAGYVPDPAGTLAGSPADARQDMTGWALAKLAEGQPKSRRAVMCPPDVQGVADLPHDELWPPPVIGPDVPDGLADLLRRFRYRPGWRFAVVAGRWPGECVLVVRTWVEDTYRPGWWGAGVSMSIVPYTEMTGDEWMRWLRHAVAQIEDHETGEWFVVDGERPFDPHKPGGGNA